MSLHASAILLNLKKSLDSHLASALSGSGVAIDWEGIVQDMSQSAEVVQPRGRLKRQKIMGNSPNGRGVGLEFLLSMNIFVRTSENAGRLAEIRDILAEAFPPGGRVPFYDYAPTSPELVDQITILDLVTDGEVAAKSGYLQHNLTVGCHLVQQWPS